jgi:hypothetical protein
MIKINAKVEAIMNEAITKNKKELDAALIKPISIRFIFISITNFTISIFSICLN